MPTHVSAVPATFFGEDLGLGEYTPLSSWPNAAAARAAFLSTLVSGVGTENFESYGAGVGAPLPVWFPGAGVVATLQGNGVIVEVPSGQTNGFGRYPTSGTKFWESSDVFNITFSAPIAAFGFYGVDIGDFRGE